MGTAEHLAGKSEQLAALLRSHAVTEWRTPTTVSGFEIFRADGPTPIRCTIYDPCVIVVAQGQKSAFLGGDAYEYNPAHYLVLPLSLPIDSRVLTATPEKPFLSFAIRIDPAVLGQIVLDVGPDASQAPDRSRAIAVSAVDDTMLDASLRLVRCLESDIDCRILAPQIMREILYRVLVGPQGALLRGAAYQDGRISQIGRALARIHEAYAEPIKIEELARAAHMSHSTFYDAFKEVTSHSPLQYLKEIRLNRARQALIWEGLSAKRAASRVGYTSASQFSREFKRRFGRPPGQEREWAISAGEIPAAPA